MAIFMWDCPQVTCRARQSAFATVGGVFNDQDQKNYIFAVCPICKTPTTFVTTSAPSPNAVAAIVGYGGDPFNAAASNYLRGQSIQAVHVASTVPSPPSNQLPDHVPENVALPVLEGLKARDGAMLPSAVYNLRKALERTVRQQNPAGTGMLKARIKQLADAQKIPPTLVELAHTVRAEGNLEVHEEEHWTVEQVEELIDFVMLLLTYVYSLPQRIAAISAHRGAEPGAR